MPYEVLHTSSVPMEKAFLIHPIEAYYNARCARYKGDQIEYEVLYIC